MDTNRLSKELREIASDKASGVSVELVGDSLAHMRGTITGTNTIISLSLLSLF
jgi:ubiquitin-conjugating enzyme (huntingtin interacting protein 2)